jgi:LPS-assembly lipoprotein
VRSEANKTMKWTSRIRVGLKRLTLHTSRLAIPRLTPHASRLTASSMAVTALLLASCGFHLRGQATLPFDSIYISGSQAFANQISRALRAGSQARVVANPKDAQVSLQILSEARERLILSLSAAGRVREITLRYRVSYRLTDAKGVEYIPTSQIVLRRDVTYSDTDVLGKEQEEALLYRDMQNDAVQQMVRRLEAAKPDTDGAAGKDAK